MKINPKIRATFTEISKKAIDQSNSIQDSDYKYLRRMLRVYKTHLTEEEQLYLLKTALELIHYRNIMVDPDNLLIISNIRLRTYMFIFLLSLITLITAAILFRSNGTVNGLVEFLARLVKIFSL